MTARTTTGTAPLEPHERETVLIVAPSGRDGALTQRILADAGLDARVCASVVEACDRIGTGVAVALFDEHVLDDSGVRALAARLQTQGDWSDFPIVVFSTAKKPRDLARSTLSSLGNVTFLDRPVQVRTMLAAVHSAIRARRRQYQVRRAIELREQFLAMLGHELRNPLASIRLAIDAMDGASSTVKQQGVIDRQSSHLARLVDDLLDVARVTHGKVTLQRTVVDFAEVVRACFLAHRAAAEASHLTYSITGATTEIWVDGDRLRLEQVVNNLLTNAIKYTPEGGIVSVEIAVDHESVALHVRDTGIGIASTTLPGIFDLFAQADRSLDRAQGGLGLGLTVVRGLVELHGGRVEASSKGLGRGSEFTVTLPLAAHAAEPVPASAKLPTACAPCSVVVVDDNDDLREMLEVLLVAGGHAVTTANDGPSGLENILDAKPDAAFVDVGLPGFDGYELARRARAAGLKDTLLVAVSGYGQPEDRRRALESGFDEHLKKPVGYEQLDAALRRVGR